MNTSKNKFSAALFALCAAAALPSIGASFWLGTGEDSSVAANWNNGKKLLDGDNFYIRDANMTGTAFRRKMKLGAGKTGSAGNSIFFEAGSEADPFIVDGNGKTLTMSYRSNDNTGNGKITVGAVGNFSGGVVLNGGTYKPTGIAVGKSSTYTGYLKLDNGAKLETVTTNSVWAYNNWIAFGKLVIDGGSEVKFGNTATSGANFLIGGGNSVAVPGAHGECHVLNGTLVNRGHVVIGYFGESSGGTGYAYMEVDGGLVTNKTGNVDIGEEGAPGDRSILRIKSGTFAANGPLRIGRGSSGALFMDGGVLDVSRDVMTMASYNAQSGEDCALVMSNGVVKTQTLQYGNGAADATVLFDGGTLQAAQSGTLVKAHSRLAVSVGPRGGVIDANGKAVAIEEELSGVGGVTFKGRGSVTLAPGNTYAGVTTVEIGTTVHVASADEIGSGLAVTVPEEAPADGTYALLAIDGEESFTDAVLSGAVAPANATLSLSANAKSVLCIYGNPQNTWIGGASGSLGEASNWSMSVVPSNGNCIIGNVTAASLTNPSGSTFAPESITFPADSAAVTISGDAAIFGIVAITNLSAVAHVFNCAVSGDAIDFYNDAMRCEFRGGITLAAPTFGGTSSNEALGLVGDWHFTSSWMPVSYNRVGVGDASGSSVTVAGELLNPDSMSIMAGSVVTAATLRVNSSAKTHLAYANAGSLVVTGEMRAEGTGDLWFRRDGDTSAATVEFGSFVNAKSGSWTIIDAPTVIVGMGGMDLTTTSATSFRNTPTLYPRGAGYEINSSSGAHYNLRAATVTLDTTQYGTDAPAVVTVNAVLEDREASNKGAVNVTGCGKVVFNSASTFSNGLSIGDTATVAVNFGSTPGSGAVSVASGATLQVAESGTVTLGGNLTLADGATLAFNFTGREPAPTLAIASGKSVTAEGAVKVKVSGTVWPKGGEKTLTDGGGFTRENVSLDETGKPDWVNGISVNEAGNIVLSVKPLNTMILVK